MKTFFLAVLLVLVSFGVFGQVTLQRPVDGLYESDPSGATRDGYIINVIVPLMRIGVVGRTVYILLDSDDDGDLADETMETIRPFIDPRFLMWEEEDYLLMFAFVLEDKKWRLLGNRKGSQQYIRLDFTLVEKW